MTLLTALLLAAAAAPTPGQIKTFGDWAVACDNVKRCEMTALAPEGDGEAPGVSIVRDAGPAGAFVIEVSPGAPPRGAVPVIVDTRDVARATPAGDTLRVDRDVAARAVAAMVRGNAMSVGPLRVSLAGSSAALRFIDAEQGRVNTVSAAVAVGARPASEVPPAPALPTVTAVRPPAGAAAPVTAALRKAMMAAFKCEEELTGASTEIERFRLDPRTTLALLPCGAGAYNFNTVPFVIVGDRATIARFDHAAGWGGASETPTLVNAVFEDGRLTSYAKARGLGDCGSSEAFVWDGTMFRLAEARVMGECRGSTNWLAVWRAQVVAR